MEQDDTAPLDASILNPLYDSVDSWFLPILRVDIFSYGDVTHFLRQLNRNEFSCLTGIDISIIRWSEQNGRMVGDCLGESLGRIEFKVSPLF